MMPNVRDTAINRQGLLPSDSRIQAWLVLTFAPRITFHALSTLRIILIQIGFKSSLVDQFGKAEVRARDIRKATRHGWELGGEAEKEISNISKSGSICQYYWTSYPQTDREKEYGIFICAKQDGGCGKFYSKLKSDESKLCPNCSKA